MRSAVFVSLAAVAIAQRERSESPYVPPYSNPNTMYLSETNSLGVVTGQPTYIPPVVTDLPVAETSPAGPHYPETPRVGGKYGNSRSTGGTPTGVVVVQTPGPSSNLSPGAGPKASNSLGGTPGSGGSTPTPVSGGSGGETPGSGSGSGSGSGGSSSTSSSSGSSQSSGAAVPALQVSSGLLGAVGVLFAAFL